MPKTCFQQYTDQPCLFGIILVIVFLAFRCFCHPNIANTYILYLSMLDSYISSMIYFSPVKEGHFMELRVFQYFLAVTREQSISGAAESLHLSQPTLSMKITCRISLSAVSVFLFSAQCTGVSIIIHRLQPLVGAFLCGHLNCQMGEPAVRGRSMPVLYT